MIMSRLPIMRCLVSIDWCIIATYNISTIKSTVLSTEARYDCDKTDGCKGEYNELAKAKENAEYLTKLNRADEQIKNG